MATLTFRNLNRLTDREIQILMREVDQKDLVVALKGAAAVFKTKVLGNMSKGVRAFITEEMEYLGPIRAEEIAEIQGRIVQQVEQLAEQGHIALPLGSKDKAKKSKVRPNKRFEQKKKKLAGDVQHRLDEMAYEQIDQMFAVTADQVASLARDFDMTNTTVLALGPMESI